MKPVICNYYLTYRCNARCSFCTIWEERSVPMSLESSVQTVCRNLDDIHRAGVKVVDFTGGEPLLYKGLGDVLRHAKNIGLRTTVTTNGILYPDYAVALSGLIDILQFSIDDSSAEGHDASKGVTSFDSVLRSVDAARTNGERATFIHTVTDDNFRRVPDVVKLAQSMRVPIFLNPCFSYADNKGISPGKAGMIAEFASGRGVTVDRGFLRFIQDGGNSIRKPRCLAVSSTIVISPDDKLILPCFHFRNKEILIEGKLASLLRSTPVIEEKKRAGRYPFCEGCTVYCYIRASLFRRLNRYFFPTMYSAAEYIFELYRAPKIRV